MALRISNKVGILEILLQYNFTARIRNNTFKPSGLPVFRVRLKKSYLTLNHGEILKKICNSTLVPTRDFTGKYYCCEW